MFSCSLNMKYFGERLKIKGNAHQWSRVLYDGPAFTAGFGIWSSIQLKWCHFQAVNASEPTAWTLHGPLTDSGPTNLHSIYCRPHYLPEPTAIIIFQKLLWIFVKMNENVFKWMRNVLTWENFPTICEEISVVGRLGEKCFLFWGTQASEVTGVMKMLTLFLWDGGHWKFPDSFEAW